MWPTFGDRTSMDTEPSEVDTLARTIEEVNRRRAELVADLVARVRFKLDEIERLKGILRDSVGEDEFRRILVDNGWGGPRKPHAEPDSRPQSTSEPEAVAPKGKRGKRSGR